MQARDLGEFALIDRIRALLPAADDDRLIVGIGDDAAVWRSGDSYTIATTDTMVAGVHFLPGRVRWEDVGWKALASNVSDIAAMGGTPTFALVTLTLPGNTPVAAIDALYTGLRDCAAAYAVTIAGGDIVAAADDALSVTVALCGEAAMDGNGEPLLLHRDAARVGDAIAVSGTLGASAAGLRALQSDAKPDAVASRLIERHMRPGPHVAAAAAAVRAGVRCAIDISDGLVQDLGHICAASGVGAELHADDVPVDKDARNAYGDDARALALTGGEDYELLLVAPDDVLSSLGAAIDTPLTVIGHTVASTDHRVRVLDRDGNEIDVDRAGFDHLRDARA